MCAPVVREPAATTRSAVHFVEALPGGAFSLRNLQKAARHPPSDATSVFISFDLDILQPSNTCGLPLLDLLMIFLLFF